MELKHIILLSSFLFSFFAFSATAQVTAKADLDQSKLKHLFTEKMNEDALAADSLLGFAHKFLKTPYRLGTAGTKSFDCSGFSSYVYKNFGYSLNRTAAGQASANGIEVHRDSLKRGDLVFFKGRNAKQKRVGHVGIVYETFPDGKFTFIHASCKYGVTITEGEKDYYRTRYVKAKRILETEDNIPEAPKKIAVTEKKKEPMVF